MLELGVHFFVDSMKREAMDKILKLVDRAAAACMPHGAVCEISSVDCPESHALAAIVNMDVSCAGGPVESFSALIPRSGSRKVLADCLAVASVCPQAENPVVVICGSAGNGAREYMRERGVMFMDSAGNAEIELGGRRIVKRPTAGARRRPRAGRRTLGFTDCDSVVIRMLLDGERMGIRELSRAAGERGVSISPSQVSKTVSGLRDAGFARSTQDGRFQIRMEGVLLDEWAAAYKLMRHEMPIEYRLDADGPDDAVIRVSAAVGKTGAITGKAGASLVDGFAYFDTVDVNSGDLERTCDFLERAGAVEVERGGNVRVRRARYARSAFMDIDTVDDIRVSSSLQIFLDLHLDARRGIEAAEHLKERMGL